MTSQAHRESKPMFDKGDPIFYTCERCSTFKWHTIREIVPIKCEKHDLTIGQLYKLSCDYCNHLNEMKRIEIYPC